MKKVSMIIAAVFLFTASQVYGQITDGVGGSMHYSKDRKSHSMTLTNKTAKDVHYLFALTQWTVNEKPIVFDVDPESIGSGFRFIMNADDYKFSGDEVQVFERGVDLIESIIKGGKVLMNGPDFTFKTGENSLLLDIKTGQGSGVVLGIRLTQWAIDKKPIEFSADGTGHIILNNALTDDEKILLDDACIRLKLVFGRVMVIK